MVYQRNHLVDQPNLLVGSLYQCGRPFGHYGWYLLKCIDDQISPFVHQPIAWVDFKDPLRLLLVNQEGLLVLVEHAKDHDANPDNIWAFKFLSVHPFINFWIALRWKTTFPSWVRIECTCFRRWRTCLKEDRLRK